MNQSSNGIIKLRLDPISLSYQFLLYFRCSLFGLMVKVWIRLSFIIHMQPSKWWNCWIGVKTLEHFRWINENQTHSDFSFPFEGTFHGYIIEISYSYIACVCYYLSYGSILLLFISICLFHHAFSKMFRRFLTKMDPFDENQNNREYFRKLIQFHVSTTE